MKFNIFKNISRAFAYDGVLALLFFFVVFAGISVPAQAQFFERLANPSMQVPVKHPPQIVLSGVKTVAVQEFSGQGGAELSDRFLQALMESGEFQVIDRGNLATIMREQGLQSAGVFSADAALRLGQLSGCGAMFIGRVTRCTVEESPPLDGGTVSRKIDGVKTYEQVYVLRVTARITASIQLVDLTTGRTYTGKLVEAVKEFETKAEGGLPEPPSAQDALSSVYQDAVDQMKRMILPWTENIKLTVYDDKGANLKVSAAQIKVGDFAGAINTLEAVLNGVMDPKTEKYLPKVYYNYGIALMYSGSPDKAIPVLEKSLQLRSTSITSEALLAAKKMLALQQEQVRKEENAVQLGGGAKGVSPANAATSKLTNADVIAMTKVGLGDKIIIAKIRKNPAGLDGSTEGMIALKKGGVSDAVIAVIGEVAP